MTVVGLRGLTALIVYFAAGQPPPIASPSPRHLQGEVKMIEGTVKGLEIPRLLAQPKATFGHVRP